MKKILLAALVITVTVSCVRKDDVSPATNTPDVDVNRFITTEEFAIPIRENFVTVVKQNGEVIAEADTPMTILVPKQSQVRSSGLTCEYIPSEEYPNFIGNNSKLYQIICFEDSRSGDYDYNDLVIHVKYQRSGNIFGFGVQPIALGSAKPIKLGCVVYMGDTKIYEELITPNDADCRSQFFDGQEGYINTYGTTVNQTAKRNAYMRSAIRNWNTAKNGWHKTAPRVEWFIEVDGGTRLYALSTKYLSESFNKDALPYGIIITNTGTEYTDRNGTKCGYDWFNYPQENKHIKDVYPELWNWLTTNASYNFADIYDGRNIPAMAFPASDLGLFEVEDVNVCHPQYRVE